MVGSTGGGEEGGGGGSGLSVHVSRVELIGSVAGSPWEAWELGPDLCPEVSWPGGMTY